MTAPVVTRKTTPIKGAELPAIYCGWRFRRRGLHRWLGRYLLETPRRRVPRPDEEVHLLLCLADHYERQRGYDVVQADEERFIQQLDAVDRGQQLRLRERQQPALRQLQHQWPARFGCADGLHPLHQ